jgi:hypothetical protein
MMIKYTRLLILGFALIYGCIPGNIKDSTNLSKSARDYEIVAEDILQQGLRKPFSRLL